VRELADMCRACGMDCQVPPVVHFDRSFSVAEHIKYAADQAQAKFGQKCKIVLVLLPSKSKDLYQAVKQASDAEHSVPSQCFVAQKASVGRSSPPMRGPRAQYCANLALKINAKVGGVNVKLVSGLRGLPVVGTGEPYMIMGADVSHPTGFDESEPSIAAVTGSCDSTLGRYACRVLHNPHRQEIIAGLEGAAAALLRNFYRRTGARKPKAIVYYRDGIDSGQVRRWLCAWLGKDSDKQCRQSARPKKTGPKKGKKAANKRTKHPHSPSRPITPPPINQNINQSKNSLRPSCRRSTWPSARRASASRPATSRPSRSSSCRSATRRASSRATAPARTAAATRCRGR
jgi:hypothetical protein